MVKLILFAYGTRPEFIKVDPLIQEFKRNDIPYKTLFTGQHYDLVKENNIDYKLKIKNKSKNRLSNIVCSIVEQFERLPLEDITSVLVQGDTTSAMAVAMAAFNNKIPVLHLEAGLRTYDSFNPYPEEFNRKTIAALATFHLCPTLSAVENLKKEGITKNVFQVGNSVLDNLVDVQVSSSNKVIITLHRREKHDKINYWFQAINKLATKHPDLVFELPAHPNPNVQKHLSILENVNVIDPYSHEDFKKELASCHSVITDSGGIQEEAAFFKKRCVVCRDYTERTEGIGTLALMCKDYDNLEKIFNKCLKLDVNKVECPYGSGDTSQQVLKIYKNLLFKGE